MNGRRIGILTGGGDAPGLNAVIRAVYKAGKQHHLKLIGFRNGFSGVIQRDFMIMDDEVGSGLLHRGGTILGTNNRDNPFKYPVRTEKGIEYKDVSPQIIKTLEEMDVEALIAIGGDGTLSIAKELYELGVPIVGVPKTIDNDLSATDWTFGFQTAVQTATDALDKLHSTAESHHRVMILEVMGRYAGWIALYSGMAGGADIILIPERKWSLDEIIQAIEYRKKLGKSFSMIVVAEGVKLPDGHWVTQDIEEGRSDPIRLGGIGQILAKMIEDTGKTESRSLVLGHLQRGGSPIAYDRILATQYGIKALDLVLDRRYGNVPVMQSGAITSISLKEATSQLKNVPMEHELIQCAKKLGIYIGH
ncbi:6-phosphofructokinase [Microaerobacter geothermalis]|uniref:6-phosphofructokinase n=1 Tax=Microaerobacter geothermalis TaxID=674972 RepID=UPI001F458B31|nr:ATP-dependent 6-phosphofructokinase [Microaerobacter geothermalis]MCF6093011.1 6-phosphofructokinase [Microaerobacter geothermalis]